MPAAPRGADVGGGGEIGGVRVDRCFAFVDLCGFTAFADRHGDERVVLVLAELRVALREASARRGVRVVKWLGDGAMLSSTMSDAVVGLVVEIDQRMAKEIPSLPIRAGLAAGPVIMFEGDDYIGYPNRVSSQRCRTALRAGAAPRAPSHYRRGVELPALGAGRGGEVGVSAWTCSRGRELRPRCPVRSLRHPVEEHVTDPVCGLDISTALSIGDGPEPRFCSAACFGSWTDSPRHNRRGPT